ncbi:MAG: pentapeptide repeat-containing protein, partial [Chloroflexota bacterium]
MWKKFETTLREHRFIVGVVLLAVLVIGTLVITERILMAMVRPEPQNDYLLRDELGFWVNVITEVFGITISVFITILILDRRAEARAQRLQREQDIKRIIREMRSTDDNEGRRAVEEARETGILIDGTLSGAELQKANLKHAGMNGANLSKARLKEVNLSGAFLSKADLSGAELLETDLSNADLYRANLNDSSVWGANLSGADMYSANLMGAKLIGTEFDEDTKLPDATNWKFDTDMSRYTNPN